MSDQTHEARIPVVEERAKIEKRLVATGRVLIRTEVNERTELLKDELTAETATVERVRVDREVNAPPPIRSEGDVLIIPVVEQRLVVERRWVLKEELHVRRQRHTETVELPVELRGLQVSVDRDNGKSAVEEDDQD